jgi:hypothetical protein
MLNLSNTRTVIVLRPGVDKYGTGNRYGPLVPFIAYGGTSLVVVTLPGESKYTVTMSILAMVHNNEAC